jgi:glycosyltransferase involved in cell wall biosynthesis
MRPKVSIIIPCYNDGRYLMEAVRSAQAQTYPNVEIIVVDDHSTDRATLESFETLRRQSVSVFATRDNVKGPSAARNAGIIAASGKYILPLDSDDRIDPGYVEKAVAVLDAQPNVGICYCKARFFGLKQGQWNLPPYSWEKMLTENVIFATAVFRKADWERVGGYDENLVYGLEDYAFWMRLIASGHEVARLDDVLFSYRIKSNSRTTLLLIDSKMEKAVEGVFQSCESIFRDNAFLLFSTLHRMQREKNSLTNLLSWRLFSPIFSMERRARQLVKKMLGRA